MFYDNIIVFAIIVFIIVILLIYFFCFKKNDDNKTTPYFIFLNYTGQWNDDLIEYIKSNYSLFVLQVTIQNLNLDGTLTNKDYEDKSYHYIRTKINTFSLYNKELKYLNVNKTTIDLYVSNGQSEFILIKSYINSEPVWFFNYTSYEENKSNKSVVSLINFLNYVKDAVKVNNINCYVITGAPRTYYEESYVIIEEMMPNLKNLLVKNYANVLEKIFYISDNLSTYYNCMSIEQFDIDKSTKIDYFTLQYTNPCKEINTVEENPYEENIRKFKIETLSSYDLTQKTDFSIVDLK